MISFLNNQQICLTGSTGMVGHAVLKYLLEAFPNIRVKAGYHEHQEPMIQNERVQYVCGDLQHEKDCRFLAKDCDVAVMAAAKVGGSSAVTAEPWRFVTDNLIMNARMLEALYLERVKRVVLIGSASLYQDSDQLISESMIDLNQDPAPAFLGFGWVVRYTEKLCQFWHQKYNLEVIILRASNIFGPYDRFRRETSNFIPALIRKAVEKMDPFEVWGSPDVTRDVLYSEDLAEGVVSLLNHDVKWGIFNIGSGARTRVSDVVSWANRSAGFKPSTINYLNQKSSTVRFRVLDCSKIQNTTGWKPHHTIEQGIQETTEWWIHNKDTWDK